MTIPSFGRISPPDIGYPLPLVCVSTQDSAYDQFMFSFSRISIVRFNTLTSCCFALSSFVSGFGWLHPANARVMAMVATILCVFISITFGACVSFKRVIFPRELL